MDCYIFEPEKDSFGRILIEKIEEIIPSGDIHVETTHSNFLADVLHSISQTKIAVIHVCDYEDIRHLILYDNLLSNVFIFIYLSNSDPTLLSKCFLLHPRMICQSENDLGILQSILKKLLQTNQSNFYSKPFHF